MKKSILTLLAIIAIAISAQAQEISKNAIGLRLGDSDGFGTEVNYQRALGDNNRLELGLGWRSRRNFDAIKIAGLYQWVWNIDGGFNWYAGVGATLGSFSYDDDFFDDDDRSDFFVNAAGTVGIEYNFDFPLLISLDVRPEIGILNDFRDDLDLDIALGIRYQF